MSTESFEVGNRSNSTLKWPQDLGDQEGGEPNFIIFTADDFYCSIAGTIQEFIKKIKV